MEMNMTQDEILKILDDTLRNWQKDFERVFDRVVELETKARDIADELKWCMERVEDQLGAMHARISDPMEGLQ